MFVEKIQEVFICDYPDLVKESYFNKFNEIKGIISPENLFKFIPDNDVKVIYHLGAISATTHKYPNKQWIDNVLFSINYGKYVVKIIYD